MAEPTRVLTVSRSALIELQDELRLVRDGYEFLDEKRILLAAEMLRQREAYAHAYRRFVELTNAAARSLVDAAADQGLGGLQVYPVAESTQSRVDVETRPYVGQLMLEARLEHEVPETAYRAVRPSPPARACGASFRAVLSAGAELAALSANLTRLVHEYRRTERRVRALENVVLPEIHRDIASMQEHLDIVDQEEVLRVRRPGGHTTT